MMRLAAVLLGLLFFAGLVVLAVAGVSGATAVLITAGAVVAMIGLGNAVGGRHTPNRSPYRPDTRDADDTDAGTDMGDSGGAAEDAER
jgi:predicted phage tail protein